MRFIEFILLILLVIGLYGVAKFLYFFGMNEVTGFVAVLMVMACFLIYGHLDLFFSPTNEEVQEELKKIDDLLQENQRLLAGSQALMQSNAHLNRRD